MRELRIIELEKKLELEKQKNEKVNKDYEKLRKFKSSVQHIFTNGQIRKLENPEKKIKWSLDDISSAICVHSAGPRAYKYLYKKKFPLPGLSTLRQWAKKIIVRPGILENVLQLMKDFSMNENDRICILSFDEMKIRSEYEYDRPNDSVLKPSNYVQVAMVRGLISKWKQPIFYQYDCRMSYQIISEIIIKLDNIGYSVVALVSDMGSTNQGLWKELEVTITKTWFQNPADVNKKVFVFADVPHLIKLIRNHFLDTGFILKNQVLNSEPIKHLIKITSISDLSINHKLSDIHLNVKKAERQKVKWAVQLLSHSTSSALRRCVSLGKFEFENALPVADFIKLVNDWFDLFNSKMPYTDSRDRMKAFGLAKETQLDILNRMNDTTSNMRAPKKQQMLPFQKGILISNSSLPALFNYLQEKFDIKYILTCCLNQDVIENFFSAIRAKGGLHDHPTALEFKYRLRSYLLGKLN